MWGFLKPKNIIVWFGVLIKVHINSDPILGPRFKLKKKMLNDYNILRVIL